MEVKESQETPEEIELKYILSDELQFKIEEIIKVLIENGFCVVGESSKENNDDYYDTKTADLLKKGGSLRIRKTTQEGKKKCKGTFKMPKTKSEVYMAREEIEVELEEETLENLKEKLKQRQVQYPFEEILQNPILNATNQRKDYILEKNDMQVCVSLDSVKYTNYSLQNTVANDSMVEIETVEEDTDSTILEEIHDILKKKFPELQPNKQSKYERGVKKTIAM